MSRRMTTVVLGALALMAAPAVASAQAQHYAVVIQGASGEEEFAAQHRGWLDSLVTVLRDKMAYDAAHLKILSEKPTAGEVLANAESVRTVLAQFEKLRETDVLFVMLIGHGTGDATTAKFNLVGPDLDVADWTKVLQPIKARLVFVDATGSSFLFLKGLAGPNRVIITSTGKSAEKYHTMFAEAFPKALDAPEGDLDKNGRISLWEAFSFASRLVKQHYEQKGELQIEHAALDDTGDGVWKTAPADERDGGLAAMTYLDSKVETRPTDPQVQMLAQQRDDLTLQVEQLKRKKASMKSEDYDKAMEQLLTDLALVSREIRRRSGG